MPGDLGAAFAAWTTTAWGGLLARLGDLPPPDHTPGEAREAADRILARPEYQWEDDRSLLERLGDWLSDQLGRFSPFGGGGLPAVFGWLLLAALVGGVVFLVVRFTSGGWRAPGRLSRRRPDHVVVTEADRHVDWRAEAERSEAAGRWREAVRARYRLLVADLADVGALGDLVGRTAGELVAEVRAVRPGAGRPFASATPLFEDVWYGGAPAGPDDVAQLRALGDDARRAAGRRGGAGSTGGAAPPGDATGGPGGPGGRPPATVSAP